MPFDTRHASRRVLRGPCVEIFFGCAEASTSIVSAFKKLSQCASPESENKIFTCSSSRSSSLRRSSLRCIIFSKSKSAFYIHFVLAQKA